STERASSTRTPRTRCHSRCLISRSRAAGTGMRLRSRFWPGALICAPSLSTLSPPGGSDMSFSIILTEKGGATQRLDFECEEITIGRVDENDICLPKGNISKKHTKIVVKDGKIIVLDLKSTNGTYVNGKKLTGPQAITPNDQIYIGDFILNVEPPAGDAPLEAPLEEPLPDEHPQEHLDPQPQETPPYEEPPP